MNIIYIYIYLKKRSTKRFVFFEFIYFVLTYVLYMCMFPACCFRQRTYVVQGLVNGVHNETLVSSLNDLWLVRWVYIGVIHPLSWSVFTLVCFYPLWYLICLSLCVCVCVCALPLEWFWVSLTFFSSVCVCVCVCVWVSLGEILCVGLRGFRFTGSSFSFFCICIHISIYIYVCVCVCVYFQLDPWTCLP